MIPTLDAQRVQLTPFVLGDAPLVQRYAGDPEVARTTLNVPHPYPEGAAEKWIASHRPQYLDRRNVVFAVRSLAGELVGAINLALDLRNGVGELGYWVGRPFWGRGYGTSAARVVVDYAFETFALNKVSARHLSANAASGRVMEKAGMIREGILRRHVIKDGVPRDVVCYGVLGIDHRRTLNREPPQPIQFRQTRDFRRLDVVSLYQANGWSAAEKPELMEALRGSHSIVSAWDGERLVGLANALSDGCLVVYYPHLLVLPEYQQRGIGRELMRLLMAGYEGFHQHIVVADGGATEFYRRCGFNRAGQTQSMWIYRGDEH